MSSPSARAGRLVPVSTAAIRYRLTVEQSRSTPTGKSSPTRRPATIVLLLCAVSLPASCTALTAATMDAAAASRAWLQDSSALASWPPFELTEAGDGADLAQAILWLDGWATAAADPRLRPTWWRRTCWGRYVRLIDLLYRRLQEAPSALRQAAMGEFIQRRAAAARLAPLTATTTIDPTWAATACDRHGHPVRLIALQGLAERQRCGALPAEWAAALASHHRAAIRQRFGNGETEPDLAALLPTLRPLWRCFDEVPYDYEGPWVRLIDESAISLARPQPVIDRGWLVGDNDRLIALRSWFGGIHLYPADRYHLRHSDLRTAADLAVAARRALWQRHPDGYSDLLPTVRSMITEQPPPATVAEYLLAWACWRAGDRASASRIIAPLADAVADDRMLSAVVLPAYGEVVRQQCITEWVQRDDRRAALRWARHLAAPSLVGTAAGGWGARLADDLAQRAGDNHTFCLPSHRRWIIRRQQLPRASQIRFLVERLRLLRQPSSFNGAAIDLRTAQWNRTGDPVINPFSELERLQLTVDERIALVDELACDRFVAIAIIQDDRRELLRLADVLAPLLGTKIDVAELTAAGAASLEIVKETLRIMIRATAAD